VGILWTESFDWISAVADLDQKYAQRDVQGINTAQARRSDQCLDMRSSDDLRLTLPETVKEVTIGFAIYFASLPTAGDVQFLSFYFNGSEECHVELSSAGGLNVYEDTTLRLTGLSGLISACTWHYIEVQAYIDTTSGSVQVKVDGSSAGSATSIKTGDVGKCDQLYFKPQTSFPDTLLDDIYVTGSSATNRGFLGSVYVQALLPNAVGGSSAWTASPAVDNYLNVDETGPDGDTTYVNGSAVGDQDSYGFQAISSSAGTVYGVGLWASAKKDAAGSRGMGLLNVQGSDSEVGACAMLTESYSLVSAFLDKDAGSAAWTSAKINSAEFGVKVTI